MKDHVWMAVGKKCEPHYFLHKEMAVDWCISEMIDCGVTVEDIDIEDELLSEDSVLDTWYVDKCILEDMV